jgi:quercetin dioxygenase-like cupin family protein
VSRVVDRDPDINVTAFGFDVGEELTEHRAGRAAVVQVLRGRLRFTVDGEELDARPVSGCTWRRGRRTRVWPLSRR